MVSGVDLLKGAGPCRSFVVRVSWWISQGLLAAFAGLLWVNLTPLSCIFAFCLR